MIFIATKSQVQIFRLAAVAYERLGDVTSKNLEALDCSALQLDGRRGHVLYIAETLATDGKCQMGAEHRIAARAALELHKKETKSAEKKLGQLEILAPEADKRIDAIEEFLSDLDEQLELQPDSEEEKTLGTLDEFIATNGDPSTDTPADSSEDVSSSALGAENGNRKIGDEWSDGASGRAYIMGRDRRVHDITDLPLPQRQKLRRSIRRPSRSKDAPKAAAPRKGGKKKGR